MLQIIGKNGGEDTLAHWPTASGMITIDEASCEVLKYLDQIWASLSTSGRCQCHSFHLLNALKTITLGCKNATLSLDSGLIAS